MKHTITAILLIVLSVSAKAQEIDTLILHHPLSQYDTIVYTRVFHFDQNDSLYHVQDFFPSGQIQMEATYQAAEKSFVMVVSSFSSSAFIQLSICPEASRPLMC
jgi:hypothetical protein